jgi:hypothetical protein
LKKTIRIDGAKLGYDFLKKYCFDDGQMCANDYDKHCAAIEKNYW